MLYSKHVEHVCLWGWVREKEKHQQGLPGEILLHLSDGHKRQFIPIMVDYAALTDTTENDRLIAPILLNYISCNRDLSLIHI